MVAGLFISFCSLPVMIQQIFMGKHANGRLQKNEWNREMTIDPGIIVVRQFLPQDFIPPLSNLLYMIQGISCGEEVAEG